MTGMRRRMFTAEAHRSLSAAADLLNTAAGPLSAESTPDTLTTVGDLTAFLKDRPAQLQWPTSTADAEQLEHVRRLRAAVAELWKSDLSTSDADLRLLNELLEGVGTKLIRSEAPEASGLREVPVPVSEQVHHVMTATIASALAHVVVTGEERRLRICRGEGCQAAIVDLTRNRSKLFCDFGNCGNRAHVRAYRARQSAEAPHAAAEKGRTAAAAATKPSAAEKAEELSRPTSVSAAAAKEFRNRMREELMQSRQQK